MKRILNLIIIFIALSATLVWAGTGTSGAQFLQITGGSRVSALGGAYTAFAQGLESVYINPAGLAHLAQREAGFTHSKYFADMSVENVAVGIPMQFGSIAISAVALLSGDIERTTIEQPQGTGENFSANDFAFNLSYSRVMTDKFSAGLTFKYLVMTIAEVQARGYAMDVGATYNTGINNIRIGFAINNFGPDVRYSGEALQFQTKKDNPGQATDVNAQYESEYFQLPLTFRVGLAYDAINDATNRLTLIVDGVNPSDQKENMAVGLEYSFKNSYFLRVGHAGVFNDGLSNGGINQMKYSLGAGANFKLGTTGLLIDYSFEDHTYLASVSRFTVGLTF